MPEVWHLLTSQTQNLELYINYMHSISSITTFYVTFQKISHGNLSTFIDHRSYNIMIDFLWYSQEGVKA